MEADDSIEETMKPNDPAAFMGTSSSKPVSEEAENMAQSMHAWREILVHLDRIFNWERPRILLGIQLGMTIFFLFIWLLEPSLLTSVAFIGLTWIGLDFSVPILAPRMFERSAWTKYEEEHFYGICEKLVKLKSNVYSTVTWIISLRQSRPTFYFSIMGAFLFIVAFIGDKFNNLFLTYSFMTIIVLTPGIIKHNVLTRLYTQMVKVVEQKMGKRFKKR